MRFMKSTLAAVILLAASVPFQANAQVGVDVIIDLPSIAILNYTEEVTVEIPSAALAGFIGGTTAGDAQAFQEGATSDTAALVGGDLEANLGLVVTEPTSIDLGAVDLLLQNVWAVRAIHANDVEVVAALGAGTTLANGGSQIGVTAATNPGAAFPAPGLAPGNAVFGDVLLTLDLGNATTPGAHSAGDPTYTLTVNLL